MTGRFFNFLVEIPVVWMVLWLGLAGLTGALLVLMVSRWGHSRPLRKCAVLSLVAHVLLACFATTVQIVSGVTGATGPSAIQVSVVAAGAPTGDISEFANEDDPWVVPPDERVTQAAQARDAPPPTDVVAPPALEPSALAGLVPRNESDVIDSSATPVDAADSETLDQPKPAAAGEGRPKSAPIMPAPAQRRLAEDPLVPLPETAGRPTPPLDPITTQSLAAQPKLTRVRFPAQPVAQTSVEHDPAFGPAERETITPAARPLSPAPAAVTTARASGARPPPGSDVTPVPTTGGPPRATVPVDLVRIVARAPTIYRNRFAPDRSRIARAHGGSAGTEAAVDAALRWLAANQNPDGRWDADRHSAGQERAVLGRNRYGAGLRADAGMTGLALLAFLGAGQTHVTGNHQETVRRGLDYLLSVQAGDGNLAGAANLYARMYCHAMATFAVSEAFAMTGDPRLQQVVRRAVRFSLAAQNPMTGGWRYLPGDPGDTSQLGWQSMALKSAQLAGIAVPQQTWLAVERFLDSVAAGPLGGLASYRPRSAPSRTMTAEALACRRLLATRFSPSSEQEATDYLLEEPPGTGRPNFYYWYYATLAMFQIQGQPWERWNKALKTALVSGQRTRGADAGSWDTNTVWGGYGGRVYCTAMATLSLEVYYRYLPVYAEAARRNRHLR